MTEFCENLLKNQSQVDPKSLKINPKWGPRGILGRPGALLGAQEGSGSIFYFFVKFFIQILYKKYKKKKKKKNCNI